MTDDAAPPAPALSVPALPPPAAPAREARLQELSPRRMWLTAAVLAVLTTGAVVLLWWPATDGLNGAELVTARLDALKIGLSIGVGSGGIVALYLAWRRQHSTEADLDNRERALAHQQVVAAATIAHQDRVARATEYDAAERRLTELYLKAVEQLGSSQAAIRHGGLYALERVAQNNPSQRQTVVDVICAYLRNPYTPPPEASGPRQLGVRRPLLRSATVRRTPTPLPHAGHAREDGLQEREVRLTAQRVLHRHLEPGNDPDHPRDTFWFDIDLDLTGAILIDFTLFACRVGTATFREATFSGKASFQRATFTNGVSFSGGTFADDALYHSATFTGDAAFEGVTFAGRAMFGNANVLGSPRFDNATFAHDASFENVTFNASAWFNGAAFTGRASFKNATFTRDAGFDQATFSRDATFDRATFTRDAFFTSTTFTADARFGIATFKGDARFKRATFTRDAFFDMATFIGDALFRRASFVGKARFDKATFARDPSFAGATMGSLAFNPVERKGEPSGEEDVNLL